MLRSLLRAHRSRSLIPGCFTFPKCTVATSIRSLASNPAPPSTNGGRSGIDKTSHISPESALAAALQDCELTKARLQHAVEKNALAQEHGERILKTNRNIWRLLFAACLFTGSYSYYVHENDYHNATLVYKKLVSMKKLNTSVKTIDRDGAMARLFPGQIDLPSVCHPTIVLAPVGSGKSTLAFQGSTVQPATLVCSLLCCEIFVDTDLEEFVRQFTDSIGFLPCGSGAAVLASLLKDSFSVGSSMTTRDTASILESNWCRARKALQGGIEMYLDKHPGTFPTIVIDEPTSLFPASNLDSDSPLSSIETLKRQILEDMIKMAVTYASGVDDKAKGRCARFIFSTSSTTGSALLSTCLGGQSVLYVPDPLSVDQLTAFNIENRSVWLKSVIPDVVKHFRMPRSVNMVLSCLENDCSPYADDTHGADKAVTQKYVLQQYINACCDDVRGKTMMQLFQTQSSRRLIAPLIKSLVSSEIDACVEVSDEILKNKDVERALLAMHRGGLVFFSLNLNSKYVQLLSEASRDALKNMYWGEL